MSTEPSPLPASSTPTAVSSDADRPPDRPADRADPGPSPSSSGRSDHATTGPAGTDSPAAPRASETADAAAPSRPTTGPAPTAEAPMAGRRQQARREGRGRPVDAPDAARRRRVPPRSTRKVRKVHRVVRHIEVWSLAKLAMVFVACGYVVAMVAGYLLWRAADRVGTIDGIEGFMEDSGGYDTFEILGDVVFRAAAGIGLVLALVTVAVVVLGAVLFNLISDLTGGIRMTVIDEDLIVAPARRPSSGPTRPGQPGPAGRPSGPPPAGAGGQSSSD